MKFDIITVFPDFFDQFLETSMIKKAIMKSYVDINIVNLRDFSLSKHQKVDDTPYGGGAGMLLAFPPLYLAISNLKKDKSKVVYVSPQGKLFNQSKAIELAKEEHLIVICGHYEGIDARILDYVDEEISIGDYVLTGGEIPAMILTDSITRLVPGVLHPESVDEDSLQKGLLKYPQYTKPESFEGHNVPDILLSGHHKNIENWRIYESLKQTYIKRPDLIKEEDLEESQIKILNQIYKEFIK